MTTLYIIIICRIAKCIYRETQKQIVGHPYLASSIFVAKALKLQTLQSHFIFLSVDILWP